MGWDESQVPSSIQPPLSTPAYVKSSVPSELIVEALYSQPPLFLNLPGAVSTLVLTTRPNLCVPGEV